MKDKEPVKLERYMFMATYHDEALEVINGNDYNAYGHLMFAINDYVLNGNVPDLNDFGKFERLILKHFKRSLTTTRTRATAGKKGGETSKAIGNSNARKNQAETKQKPSRNEAETKQKPTIENKIENKNEIEEGITSVIPKKNIEKNARALNDHSSIKAKSWNNSNFNEDDFMNFFNSTMGSSNVNFSYLCLFNEKRKKKLKERLQEYGKKKVVEVIRKAATSKKFAHEINYHSNKGKITIDELLGNYFTDLLNGKYDD